MAMIHDVPYVNPLPPELAWESDAWGLVSTVRIDQFREESSAHRPVSEAKIVHDGHSVAVLFRVQDRYVRAAPRAFQGPVCRDSCVEFFFRPLPDAGYFNLETNCGGVLHASYIEDWRRVGDGFAKRIMLTEAQAERISVVSSLPSVVEPESTMPTTWMIDLRFHLSLLEPFLGTVPHLSGTAWTANFYKCGDETSHPHWASWSPVRKLNFHDPECFGQLRFS